MVTTQKHRSTNSLSTVILADVPVIADCAMIDDRMLSSIQGLLLRQF